jgi:predicted DNA-binding ribbon-helix-helix protein
MILAPTHFVKMTRPSFFVNRHLMSTLRKRSINLSGHATSLALEPEFWAVLETMASEKGISMAALIGQIDQARPGQLLASACRLAVLAHVQARPA